MLVCANESVIRSQMFLPTHNLEISPIEIKVVLGCFVLFFVSESSKQDVYCVLHQEDVVLYLGDCGGLTV